MFDPRVSFFSFFFQKYFKISFDPDLVCPSQALNKAIVASQMWLCWIWQPPSWLYCLHHQHPVSSYFSTTVQVDKRHICMGLISIWSAYKFARIWIFNILHWTQTKPVQMCLLSNCTSLLRWYETGLLPASPTPSSFI